MSNFQTTVSIADIYGAEWWERNKAELEREWEYGLGVATEGQAFVFMGPHIEWATCSSPRYELRIILHRRKPKPPTLREVYGVDEVTIPAGWEWTGEWRETTPAECAFGAFAKVDYRVNFNTSIPHHRLILRERPKRVWFKAEEGARKPEAGDWYWWGTFWDQAQAEWVGKDCLCATRHEETDTTVQIVTQADIDAAQKGNN